MKEIEIILRQHEEVLSEFYFSEKSESNEVYENTLSQLIITNSIDLMIEIIGLKEKVSTREGIKWLQSCLLTRYLFELVANHSVLKYSPTENKAWEKYLNLRNLQIWGNGTYGIEINSLPNKTKTKKLFKNKANFYKGWKQGEERIEENIRDFIKLEDPMFRFDDPFDMNMHEKLAFIDCSNPDVFFNRWKMYSQISHASSFSLWPMWIDPVPHTDALQCLTILLKTEYKYQQKEFDSNRFEEVIDSLIL